MYPAEELRPAVVVVVAEAEAVAAVAITGVVAEPVTEAEVGEDRNDADTLQKTHKKSTHMTVWVLFRSSKYNQKIKPSRLQPC